MFRRRVSVRDSVTIWFCDRAIEAAADDSVAAALLTADLGYSRKTPVSAASRLPFCMMGVCFDCLVEIDGVPNRQACMEIVEEGMKVRRQNGTRKLGS